MTAEQLGPELDISPETSSSGRVLFATTFNTNREEERKVPSNKTPIPLPTQQRLLSRLSRAQQKVAVPQAGEGGKASLEGTRGGWRWTQEVASLEAWN